MLFLVKTSEKFIYTENSYKLAFVSLSYRKTGQACQPFKMVWYGMVYCDCFAFESAQSNKLHLLQPYYNMFIQVSRIVFML